MLLAIIFLGNTNKNDKYHNNTNDIPENNLINPYVVEDEDYYQLIQGDNFQYYYCIFDKDKNIVKEGKSSTRMPHLSLIDGHIVKVWMQAGTGMSTRWCYYYDVEKDTLSETFYSVYDEENGKLVSSYFNTLIIRDIFDEEKYYHEITIDKIQAEFAEPFTDVKFIENGKQLQVTYYVGNDNNDYKEATEIVELP